MDFRAFFLESEYNKEVKKTLQKVPKKHRDLLKGYKYKFQPNNALKGDGEHIGYVDEENKVITIAAPWNYGREYTFLHEMGHLVWKYFMDKGLKKKWKILMKKHKQQQAKKNTGDSLDQNEEEIFCMCYAANYCKHPVVTFYNDKWNDFIQKIPS